MTGIERIVFDNMYARRSIRRYVDGKQVEKEKIVKLLEAAMAAPSACNIQPWDFVVVTEPEMLKSVKSAVMQGDYNAPMLIVVCGYAKFIPWDNDVGTVDCAAAIENMLLAAEAMDLGSVWIGGFDADAVRNLLGIPADIHPVGIVYFGYPDGKPEPRTQYTEQAVYWEKYDNQRPHEKRAGCIV